MAALRMALLGPPELWLGTAPLRLPTRKLVALAAHLAALGRAEERGRLADLLWEGGEAAARRNLRQELHRLKGTPAKGLFGQSGTRLSLGGVETDLAACLERAGRGDWAGVLALWRGEFLAGLELRGAPAPFEEWLALERERWAGRWR